MLDIENIHTYYGESYVIRGVTINLHHGEIVTLLGRNGAGKTTTLRSVMGLTPPRRGRIIYKEKEITNAKTFEIARLGISMVPEDRRILKALTVEENLNLAVQKSRNGRWNLNTIFELFPGLIERKRNKGYQLSGGEQQMLAIARALMANPELILLDEPSEGLAPLLIKAIAQTIIKIANEKISILLVEQNVEMTIKIAHRHYVMDEGKIIFTGTNDEFKQNQYIRDKYLAI